MSPRQEPALGPPPPSAALTRFPRWTLPPSRRVWRAHRAHRGPWWFASTGDGRFDLAEPAGTCYLAANAETALRESLGRKLLAARALPSSVFRGVVVSALHLPESLRLADTRSARAVAAGVTREIHTLTPYELPQRWAAAFHASGFDGVRYEPRHTTGPRDVSFAVFGPHGRREWPVDPAPRSAATIAAAAGVVVADPPRRPTVVPPPNAGGA